MRGWVFAGVVLWSGAVLADLPAPDASGWYRWAIDNDEHSIVVIRLKDGQLADLRLNSDHINCHRIDVSAAIDLGIVTPDENFRWFLDFVENRELTDGSREIALVGLLQAGNDEAYAYIESLIIDDD